MEGKCLDRPRVLVMSSTFPTREGGGEPAFVFELSRRLQARFDVSVLAPRTPGAKKMETLAGLRVVRFPYFFNRWEKLAMHGGGILNQLRTHRLYYLMVPFFLFGQLAELWRLLRRESFDLIHAHWIIPQGLVAVCGLAITGRKIPLLCTSHGGDLFALRWKILEAMKKLVMRRSDAVTVVSRAMKSKVEQMGIAGEKIHVLPMGVDLKNHFTPDPDVKRRDCEILFVGRLVEKKGVQVLLKAMPQILKKYPVLKLTIAGSGPMEGFLKKQTEHLQIADQVEFLGAVSQAELPNLYRRATLAVFPFLVAGSGDQEGFGLVQVEAMGCGCPVISGDLPAVSDIVEHQKTGLLFTSGDAAALAEAVIRALNDPDLRLVMAGEARRRVTEKFDWRVISEKYAGLYEKLISK